MRLSLLATAAFILLFCSADCLAQNEAPRKVSPQELDNLVAFTRLAGDVRYFHPSDEAAAADWNIVASEGIQAVQDAKDADDLAARLQKFFQPLAPTLKVFAAGKAPEGGGKLDKPKEATRLLAWRHFSTPVPRQPDRGSSLRVDLLQDMVLPVKLEKEVPLPDPARPFAADLGGGVSCLLPLALYADDQGTLPRGDREYLKKFSTRPADFVPSAKDRSTRLAAIALAWNVPQHFFPYFDVVKTDWQAELRPALEKAAIDKDETEFYPTLRRMLAALQDGHVTLIGPGLPEAFYPSVRWDWVEEQLTVVRVGKQAAELLRPGDIVLKIDGRGAATLIAERTEKASGATVGFRRRAVMMVVAAGKKDSGLELEVQSGSSLPRRVILQRTISPREFFDLGSERRPEPLTEIKPGVWYIDVANAKPEDFEKQIDKFAAATGLVFDVRGYPRISLDVLLGHLLDKPITAVPVYLPVVLYPDRQHLTFLQGRSDPLEPKAPRFKAKVVFLTDARAISAAETYLAVAEHYHLGDIIGSPTAGTNGNVRVVALPGGYEMQTTGIKVLQFDGTPFHGRGVPLTLTVKRTLRGAAEERDEVLEEALKRLAG